MSQFQFGNFENRGGGLYSVFFKNVPISIVYLIFTFITAFMLYRFLVFQVSLRLTAQYAAQRCVAAPIPTCIFYYNGFKQAISYKTFCQGQHGRLFIPRIRIFHGLASSPRNPEGFRGSHESWYLATGHSSKVRQD